MRTENGVWISSKPECDDPDCKAVNEPKTVEELKATLEHWESHRFLNGCSHGC